MIDNENLTSNESEVATQVDSSSVDISNLDQAEKGIDNIAWELASDLVKDFSDEGKGSLQSDSTESEEPTEETVEETEETTSEEPSDVETPNDEAEDDVKEDEEPTEESDEVFEVDYNEIKDAIIPIKIKGEVKKLSFGEIQNQLARAEAASTKSREASQKLEELEAKEKSIDEEKAFLKQQREAVTMNNELATRVNHIRGLEAKLKTAVEKKDSHSATLLREQINAVSKEANEIHQRVTQANEAAHKKHIDAQFKILESKGYKDIVTDAYTDYLKNNASQEAHYAITSDASLAILAEKARLWDEAQTKGKTRKLTKKTSTLRSGGGNISKSKSANEKATAKRLSSGKATAAEAEDAILKFAQQQLFS